jgi:AraC family transcriptional regulator of adaptative response/methylated-DNA-[protein]-cysteine methyltransferase
MRTSTGSPPHFLAGRDFDRIARAIAYIDGHFREQPRLAALAGAAGLSPFHFERLFRRWAGVTPRQYLAAVTGAAARNALDSEPSVLDAAHAVGLSGAGRLHDLTVTLEALTPGEIRRGGAGIDIRAGFAATPFGTALVGATARGLCHLAFVEAGEESAALAALAADWPAARLVRDDAGAAATARRIWAGGPGGEGTGALRLAVRGTNFQLRVWRALLEFARDRRVTYTAIAQAIGEPRSARAVGNAVGANPIAWLIPCHNVLRTSGALGGYRWGEHRKRAMLAWTAGWAALPELDRRPARAGA